MRPQTIFPQMKFVPNDGTRSLEHFLPEWMLLWILYLSICFVFERIRRQINFLLMQTEAVSVFLPLWLFFLFSPQVINEKRLGRPNFPTFLSRPKYMGCTIINSIDERPFQRQFLYVWPYMAAFHQPAKRSKLILCVAAEILIGTLS